MFTLKFLRNTQDGDEIIHSVSCRQYTVHKRKSGKVITVTTYSGELEVEGVDRHITTSQAVEKDYFSCYVENSNGKTIDKIHVKGL